MKLSPNIVKHLHTKRRVHIHIVTLGSRISRDEYLIIKKMAVLLDGYWSKRFGKSPAGFAFETRTRAMQFCNEITEPAASEPQPEPVEAFDPGAQTDFASLMDRRAQWQPELVIEQDEFSTRVDAPEDPAEATWIIDPSDVIPLSDLMPTKPKTPQIDALPGSTPLGLKDAPKQEKRSVSVSTGPGALSALVAQLA